eukprot:1878258-Rhodomonas_salina.6
MEGLRAGDQDSSKELSPLSTQQCLPSPVHSSSPPSSHTSGSASPPPVRRIAYVNTGRIAKAFRYRILPTEAPVRYQASQYRALLVRVIGG